MALLSGVHFNVHTLCSNVCTDVGGGRGPNTVTVYEAFLCFVVFLPFFSSLLSEVKEAVDQLFFHILDIWPDRPPWQARRRQLGGGAEQWRPPFWPALLKGSLYIKGSTFHCPCLVWPLLSENPTFKSSTAMEGSLLSLLGPCSSALLMVRKVCSHLRVEPGGTIYVLLKCRRLELPKRGNRSKREENLFMIYGGRRVYNTSLTVPWTKSYISLEAGFFSCMLPCMILGYRVHVFFYIQVIYMNQRLP